MGTNYYAVFPELNVCEHCKRGDGAEELHIGKSSAGWCFALHVIPERGLNTLDEWKALLSQPGITIRDEYGRTVALEYMLNVITDRSWPAKDKPEGYTSWEHFNQINHSEQGPKGLARHEVGRYCSGHGEGTWDYCLGEFS